MKYLFILLNLFLITSCGKSPLLMEKEKQISGNTSLETGKFFKSQNISLELSWLTPVNSIDEARALLIVKKNGTATDLPDQFSLFLWMPTMGHGSSPIRIQHFATGVYELSEIYFIMDGLWQLKIQLKNAATVLEEINFEYSL